MPDVTRLLAAIEAEESNAIGSEGDELTQDRATQLDYYMGRPFGNEIEGRSEVVSRDVMDTIEWMKPSLIRIFSAGDAVAKFEPRGPEDEKQAEQETDFINYIVTQKNDWMLIVYEWITDALLTRNAYCYAYFDDKVDATLESYDGLTDDQMAMILQETQSGRVQIVGHNQYPSPDLPPQQVMDPMTGQVMLIPPPTLHDVQFRNVRSYGCVRYSVLPPERCMVSERATGLNLDEADFFEYWEMKSISELRSMGFDVPDNLPDDGGHVENETAMARDVTNATTVMNERGGNGDPSMRQVRLKIVWIRHDYDGDGLAERLQVYLVGRHVLRMDEVDQVPVACIVPIIIPHRHVGLSVADQVMDIELIKSVLLRRGLDNLYAQVDSGAAISNKVNHEDMLTSRPNKLVRVDGIPAQEIMPFVTPQTFPAVMQGMEYLDQIRENRSGTNRYFTGVDQGALNKTASGIAQLTSSASQRVELIARVFAEGFRRLMSITHALTLKHSRMAETIRIRGDWVNVDPRQWKTRSDMSISVGLGVGNREQLMANLQRLLQLQMPGLQLGICTPQNVYNTATRYAEAAGFANADAFFTDPAKQKPKGPPPPDPIKVGELQIKAFDAETGRMEAQTKAVEAQQSVTENALDRKLDLILAGLQENARVASQAARAPREPASTVNVSNDVTPLRDEVRRIEAESASKYESLKSEMTGKFDAMLAELKKPKKKIVNRDSRGRLASIEEKAE